MCLNEITNHAFSSSSSKIGSRLRQLLMLFKTQSLEGPPRRVCGVTAGCSFIFTDACYETGRVDRQCGLGGVIYNSDGSAMQAFSICLTQDQIASLGGFVKKTIIFEAELLALIVSFILWKNLICNAPVVFFVDNNSARDVAISANSRSKTIEAFVEQLLRVEDMASSFCWFARVPSPSNPADDPSRGETKNMVRLGIPFVEVGDVVTECLAKLCNFLVG